MTPATHLARAADAAAYAETLRTDLASLCAGLDRFHGASGLAFLRENGRRAQQELDAIARRLEALGRSGDHTKYPLSDTEHAALDSARALRERMVESLARFQRAELLSPRPRG